MMAQLILSVLLIGVLAYASVAATRARLVGVLIALLAVAGLYFVWWPDVTNRLAHVVGIGRGADLILYLWVVISMLVALNLHLRLKTQAEATAKLARAMALIEARAADRRDAPSS